MGLNPVENIINGVKGIFESTSKPLTSLIESKENQIKAQGMISTMMAEIEVKLQAFAHESHKADMASDNTLSKIIRPIGLIWLMFMNTGFICAVVFSVLEFEKLELVGTILATLNAMAFGFYYGGKGLQRLMEAFQKPKK